MKTHPTKKIVDENGVKKIVPKFGKGKCSNCGKEFYKKRRGQKACSRLCRNKHWHVLNPVTRPEPEKDFVTATPHPD